MENQNQNQNRIKLLFIYESSEFINVENDIKDNLGTAINVFSEKIGIESSLVIFLYDGRLLENNDYNKPISEIINKTNKDLMQMNILAYKKLESDPGIIPTSDDINILLIFDSRP